MLDSASATHHSESMHWVHDDGGRAAAGYKGNANDCVIRAIAIAAGVPYLKVYQDLHRAYGKSPGGGVPSNVYRRHLAERGWKWVPTMKIGSGCRVHLTSNELPSGRIIVRLSRHLAAVIDGILHDTFDCSRNGTRCVYGYWTKKQ